MKTKTPFKKLSDRDKIQAICELFGVPCYEPIDAQNRGRSLFVAGRRLMFNRKNEMTSVLDYEGRELPKWVEEQMDG